MVNRILVFLPNNPSWDKVAGFLEKVAARREYECAVFRTYEEFAAAVKTAGTYKWILFSLACCLHQDTQWWLQTIGKEYRIGVICRSAREMHYCEGYLPTQVQRLFRVGKLKLIFSAKKKRPKKNDRPSRQPYFPPLPVVSCKPAGPPLEVEEPSPPPVSFEPLAAASSLPLADLKPAFGDDTVIRILEACGINWTIHGCVQDVEGTLCNYFREAGRFAANREHQSEYGYTPAMLAIAEPLLEIDLLSKLDTIQGFLRRAGWSEAVPA